jgi:hypothetical protein
MPDVIQVVAHEQRPAALAQPGRFIGIVSSAA